MPLKMYEEAISLVLHEQIDARVGGLVQDLIAVFRQRADPDFVPTRLREAHNLREPGGEHVVAESLVFEDAKLLVAQRGPLDAITMQYTGVRGQARQYSGCSVLFGPIKNTCQGAPVRLIAQIALPRLGAGNDSAVDAPTQQIFDGYVKVAQMFQCAFTARDIGKVE